MIDRSEVFILVVLLKLKRKGGGSISRSGLPSIRVADKLTNGHKIEKQILDFSQSYLATPYLPQITEWTIKSSRFLHLSRSRSTRRT